LNFDDEPLFSHPSEPQGEGFSDVAKFNVGVGDAFPVETEGAQPRDPEIEDEGRSDYESYRRERIRRWRRRNRFWFVKVSLILLVIYGALAAFGGHGPRGLLLAAAIVFGVGLVTSLFRDDDDRPRRRREGRRSWGER
jgi:hypothetical protein